jgi:hypothetical protein
MPRQWSVALSQRVRCSCYNARHPHISGWALSSPCYKTHSAMHPHISGWALALQSMQRHRASPRQWLGSAKHNTKNASPHQWLELSCQQFTVNHIRSVLSFWHIQGSFSPRFTQPPSTNTKAELITEVKLPHKHKHRSEHIRQTAIRSSNFNVPPAPSSSQTASYLVQVAVLLVTGAGRT